MNEMRKLMESIDEAFFGKQAGPSQQGEMSSEEIEAIGKERGLSDREVWRALILSNDREEGFWEMEWELKAPSGETVGRFDSLQDLPLDVKDPATGKMFRVLTDHIYVIHKTTPEQVNDMFDWHDTVLKAEDDKKEHEQFYGWMEKNPFESVEEGWPQEETHAEMVEYWKQSLSSSIVRKGVFTQMYDAAGQDIDELNAAIADQAESIADSYHGSGEGIGTSDVNHFIYNIAQQLGIDDIFGWNKPRESIFKENSEGQLTPELFDEDGFHVAVRKAKFMPSDILDGENVLHDLENISPDSGEPKLVTFRDQDAARKAAKKFGGKVRRESMGTYRIVPIMKSDDEMERDKTNRYAKYNKAIRGKEGLGENEDVATEIGGPYEEKENWEGKKVKVTHTTNGQNEGEVGTVVKADWYHDESGSKQAEFDVKLDSGKTIKLFPGEWSYDQLEVIVDPYNDFMLDNPFEGLEEAKGRVVEVPPEFRGTDPSNEAGATSRDVERFLADLGPDDDVSHDVVDPETGELLDWPTKEILKKQDDEEMDQYWRSQGGTKRERGKAAYKAGQGDDFDDVPTLVLSTNSSYADPQEMAYTFLDELRNSDFYNVVWKEVADLVDDPDSYAERDYDIGGEIPVAMKRKDGKKLTQDDHDNIEEIAKAVKAASTMGNVGLGFAGTSNEGTTARFYPSFM